MKRRLLPLALALLLLFMGCSSGTDAPVEAVPGESQTQAGDDEGGGEQGRKENGDKKDRDDGDDDKRSTGDDRGDDGGGDDGGGSDDDRFTEGGAEDDNSSAAYPAAGRYVYAQRGTEDFCQTTCDRRRLPARQIVEASYQARDEDAAIVVTEARASEERLVRTTTRYTRSNAVVTELHAEYDYNGFRFSNTYEPKPPVQTMSFPLQANTAYEGQWRAETSGDYRYEVLGREAVATGGGTVQAFKIESVTHFRGEFDGQARITVWIDPATKVPVKTEGKMELKSNFGTYKTDFAIVLRSGPRYS